MKLIYTLIALFFSTCLVYGQTPFPKEGKVFDDEILPEIYIEISPTDLETILDPANIFSEVHYPANFVFDNGESRDTIEDIGFRLRGNTSQSAAKKSFKISFNTFEPGRKYRGLEKMNINGEHNDPSVVRSKLCWDLCRQMGIPASRSNHVKLYINDEYWGLYINVEHVDEEFVQLRFGQDLGNLYKCLWPANLNYLGSNPNLYKLENGGRRVYELKTNTDQDDYSGLAHFIDVLNNTPNNELPCELEKVFDVQNYLKVIAMDILTANWDGPIFNQNNFYLYDNPQTGKIHYIPYDLDNTFGIQWFGEWTNRNIYSWSPSGEPRPIYTKIMANDHYRAQFTYYMEEFMDLYFNEDSFFDAIDVRKNLIASAIPEDPLYPQDYGFDFDDFNNSYEQGAIAGHVPLGIKEYISGRRASATNQLENNNAAPIISNIHQQIGSNSQDHFIRVTIEDHAVQQAKVVYTFNGQPGEALLHNDGQHSDGSASDHIFGAIIPAFNQTGTLEYHIEALDDQSANSRFPFCESFTAQVYENTTKLFINEFMADNESTVTDNVGEYDDWIELYNSGSTPIELENYFLSDKADNLMKWQLPGAQIQPGEFLLIWADNDIDQGDFHAGFRLNADGEAIYLSNASGTILDYVVFGDQKNDRAIGRLPNGTGFMQSVFPTPGASNEPPLSTETALEYQVKIFPNPFVHEIQISADRMIHHVSISNLLGQELFYEELQNTEASLNLSGLDQGIYLLTIDFEDEKKIIRKIMTFD